MSMNFEGYFSNNKGGNIVAKLYMVEFKQDDINIIYAPAVEVYGYGKTEEEAKKSFITGMEEFFSYTTSKNTFISELKRLGWKIKGHKQKTIHIPDFSDLIKNNKHLIDILNTREVRTFKEDFALPIPA